ncbi:MAG: hypothetical protein A3F12_07265 [Gammaproteobacteria bacterium RIFCSPHIGHO2_12_FULL_38_14]|nr:MAG: hypothetical protein A3F12_07265 [Gammaproteobacteria bacterium RIFCSPHIGHO2_12_FULL_38_14]
MALNLQTFKEMPARQKATIVVFALVIIILLWQIMGLFGGGGGESAQPIQPDLAAVPGQPQIQGTPTQPVAPQPAALPRQAGLTPREMALLKLQQETELKYITAVNELQMLKIERQIAENNKAIMSAKLDTITAQKNIVNLLTVQAPPAVPRAAYAQSLGASPAPPPEFVASAPPSQPEAEVSYTVVSVSQIKYKWNAVLGYQGRLYNVTVGDVLPSDGSKVVSIDTSGVVLEKEGVRRKFSLVPII